MTAENDKPNPPPEPADLLAALRLAISAMNAVPSFDTGLPDPDRRTGTLTSYRLLPKLEAVVRQAEAAKPPKSIFNNHFYEMGWRDALEAFAQKCEEHPDFHSERSTAIRYAEAARKMKEPTP